MTDISPITAVQHPELAEPGRQVATAIVSVMYLMGAVDAGAPVTAYHEVLMTLQEAIDDTLNTIETLVAAHPKATVTQLHPTEPPT